MKTKDYVTKIMKWSKLNKNTNYTLKIKNSDLNCNS